MTRIWLGLLALAAFLAVRLMPIWHGYTAPQVARICTSPLGYFAQALSARAAHMCSLTSGATWAGWACLAFSALAVLSAFWAKAGRDA